MKKLIICIVLMLMPLGASKLFAQYAQKDPVTLELKGTSISAHQYGMLVLKPLSEVMGQDLYKSYKKARSMHGWGIALTCIGGAALIPGGALIGSGLDYPEGDIPRFDKNPLIIIGTAVTAAGVASLAGGVAMMVIGKKKIKNMVSEFNLAATQNGVGLTMNF